jgi:hypothetical protein
MPEQEPVAPQQEPASHETAEGEWLKEDEELPHRPRRRRLLGVGANPIPIALLGVLLTACGFIGGVLVEKGQTSSSSSSSAGIPAGFAARLRGLSGGASGAGAGTGASTGAGTGSSSSGGSNTGFTPPTAGTVAYLSGSTLYVTNAEGNTLKVTTSSGTTVTKTVKSSLRGIHPGETVAVTGATDSSGVLSAESIRVGSGGRFGGLLGESGAGGGAGGSSSRGSGGSGGSSGAPPLFGGG